MGTTPQYLERYRWLHHEAQHPRNANASGRPPQIFGHHPGFPEFHRGSRSCATARRAGLDSPPGGGRPTAPRCAGLALTVVIALAGWPESGGTSTTARTAGVWVSAAARQADGADRLPGPATTPGPSAQHEADDYQRVLKALGWAGPEACCPSSASWAEQTFSPSLFAAARLCGADGPRATTTLMRWPFRKSGHYANPFTIDSHRDVY
jgi:hypothetical protein